MSDITTGAAVDQLGRGRLILRRQIPLLLSTALQGNQSVAPPLKSKVIEGVRATHTATAALQTISTQRRCNLSLNLRGELLHRRNQKLL